MTKAFWPQRTWLSVVIVAGLLSPAVRADDAPIQPKPTNPVESTGEAILGLPGTVAELIQPISRSVWSELWEKAQISASATPFGQTLQMGDLALGLNLSFEAKAYPAFVADLQQRVDTYTFTASPSLPIDGLGLNGSLSGQMIFSRLYPTKAAATFTVPYWLNKYPLTAETLLKNLDPGDLARLDLSLGVSLGKGRNDGFGSTNYQGSLALNISRGSELIVDVYRMKDSMARVRILALRNQAEINATAGLNIVNLIDAGIGLWNRLFGHLFSINLLSLGATWTPIQQLPLEAYMVDYVFDMSKPDAVTAYNTLFNELHDWQLFSALNFQLGSATVASRLASIIAAPEAIALQDRNKPAQDRAVDRLFKGESETLFGSFTRTSKIRLLVDIWDRELLSNRSTVDIRGYDRDDKALDLIYYSSTHNDTFSAVQNIWQTLETNSSEVLFQAQRKTDSGTIELVPTAPLDIELIRNLSDASLGAGQIAKAKSLLDLSLPAKISQQIPWGTLTDGTSKINAYVNIKFLVHGAALALLQPLSDQDLEKRIRDLVTKDPYADYVMTINTDNYAEGRANDEALLSKMDQDIQALKIRILVLMDSKASLNDKLKALDDLRNLSLFDEVGPALLISLLPPEVLQDQIYVEVKAAGLDQTPVDFQFGTSDTSKNYSSFRFMIAMLNNHSFDMRVQLDTEGHFSAIDPTSTKNQCPRCDAVAVPTTPQP